MPPQMETVPVFDPQQPPRRRWAWAVGLVAIVVLVLLAIYAFSFNKHSGISTDAPTIKIAAKQKEATSLDSQVAELRIVASSTLAANEAYALTLEALIASSPEEKARYERHQALLSVQNKLGEQLQIVTETGKADSLFVANGFSSSYQIVSSQLESGFAFAQEIRLEVAQRLAALSKQLGGGAAIGYAEIKELMEITQLLKQESEIHYISRITHIMLDSPVSMSDKINLVSSYLVLHDPVINDRISAFSTDIATGNTGSVVVTESDKNRASELLSQLKGGSD